MKHELTSALTALLIVTSAFAMPMVSPVGTASATHECDTIDAAVAAATFTYVNKDKCTNNHVDFAVEEVRDAETAQDKVDIYSAANGQKAQSQNYNVLYDNYLQDTESIAWSKAEVAVVEAYENGSSKAEAKVAAKEAIAEYYSVKQLNLIESYNTSVTSIDYLSDRVNQESFDKEYINPIMPNPPTYFEEQGEDYIWWVRGTSTETVTLVNSSTRVSQTIKLYGEKNPTVQPTDSTYVGINDGQSYLSASADYSEPDSTDAERWGAYVTGIEVRPPNNNYDKISYMSFVEYKNRWDTIQTKNNNLQSEADTFVDGIWTDLENGNIDSQDVVSRNTLMFEYGTATANGNGTYYDSIGALAQMGLSSPDLNNTGQMTVTNERLGNTYEGMLFARNVPNSQWETGTTYDAANIGGPVFMATTDGNMTEFTGNFTIESAVDTEGNEQTTIQTKDYNYQTSNTTELNDKYSELLSLTQELQDRSEAVGGTAGSTTTDNKVPAWLTEKYGGIPLWGIIIMALAGAYVVSSARGKN